MLNEGRAVPPTGFQFNIQHSTFDIQHSTFNIQHSTFNIRHSTFNIQHSTFNIAVPPTTLHPSPSTLPFTLHSSPFTLPPPPRSMNDAFHPSWFLRSPHLQTMWGRLTRSRRLVPLRREVLTTPDDDDLILDHLDTPVRDRSLRFILVHGLEGSSNSVYIQGLLSVIARHGLRATAITFRSCARDPHDVSRMLPNRRPRFYHSGETGDFDFVVRTLAAREPDVALVGVGASLGGNQLLKWLGEHPGQTLIRAAAAMSVPLDLAAGAAPLEHGLGRSSSRAS